MKMSAIKPNKNNILYNENVSSINKAMSTVYFSVFSLFGYQTIT